ASPKLAGNVNWGTTTVIGIFAGMLYGGSKEAAASVPLPHRAAGLATARKVEERSCRLSSVAVDVNHQLLVLTALTQTTSSTLHPSNSACTNTNAWEEFLFCDFDSRHPLQ
ncbi:hypothetical protein S245_047235, partial [Arachis hypogaea]